jgi:hypothetical protein
MEGTTIIAATAAVVGLYYIWQSVQDSDNDPQRYPPTKQNPGGGDPVLPPPGSDPIHAPINLLPPDANTSYQTSTKDYPKEGFCGVAIGYRGGGVSLRTDTLAWGPLMGQYDSLASCLGRKVVRDTAHTYMTAPGMDPSWWENTYNVAWVTADPWGTPPDMSSIKYDSDGNPINWPDNMGCYFYRASDNSIIHSRCGEIAPMGKPDQWDNPVY